jgi:hypothetical protein
MIGKGSLFSIVRFVPPFWVPFAEVSGIGNSQGCYLERNFRMRALEPLGFEIKLHQFIYTIQRASSKDQLNDYATMHVSLTIPVLQNNGILVFLKDF